MKDTDHKKKHKEDFRVRILEAAKKLFVTEGIEATSIRKIAREIAFSPTTIYLYYKDKGDIVYALHLEGFTILRNRMQALMYVEHPFERLKAFGKAYISFAVSESAYYELLFMMKEPMQFLENNCMQSEWEEGDRVFDMLYQTVGECQQMGYFPGMDTSTVSLQAWSTVHGIASLYVSGHLMKLDSSIFQESPAEVFLESTFKMYISMLDQLKN